MESKKQQNELNENELDEAYEKLERETRKCDKCDRTFAAVDMHMFHAGNFCDDCVTDDDFDREEAIQ